LREKKLTRQLMARPERKFQADWQDRLLDEALEETFPASDPISPMCPDSFKEPRPATAE
jgi:hypothetical protein